MTFCPEDTKKKKKKGCFHERPQPAADWAEVHLLVQSRERIGGGPGHLFGPNLLDWHRAHHRCLLRVHSCASGILVHRHEYELLFISLTVLDYLFCYLSLLQV